MVWLLDASEALKKWSATGLPDCLSKPGILITRDTRLESTVTPPPSAEANFARCVSEVAEFPANLSELTLEKSD